MIHFLLIFLTSAWFTSELAQADGISTIRLPQENYFEASIRSSSLDLKSRDDVSGLSAEDLRRPINELELSEFPRVPSLEKLTKEFHYARDTRFFKSKLPDFLRRITWLYPDDGCFARAEMASRKLIAHNFPPPKKLFAFGNLIADTKNSPIGYVEWWYHVAISYRVDDVIYVMDPAVDPDHLMTINQWNKAIGGEYTEVYYSVCSHKTYDANSDCLRPKTQSNEFAESDLRKFFDVEWKRILQLGREPAEELGDNPPWLKHQ